MTDWLTGSYIQGFDVYTEVNMSGLVRRNGEKHLWEIHPHNEKETWESKDKTPANVSGDFNAGLCYFTSALVKSPPNLSSCQTKSQTFIRHAWRREIKVIASHAATVVNALSVKRNIKAMKGDVPETLQASSHVQKFHFRQLVKSDKKKVKCNLYHNSVSRSFPVRNIE